MTSPSDLRMTAINSSGGVRSTFYMPVWSVDELKALLQARKGEDLSSKEEEELQLRYLRFGGIPRYIARANMPHQKMIDIAEQQTKETIMKLSGEQMKEMLYPFSNNPQQSGRIIHITTEEDFKYKGKKFATEMIEREILVHYHRRERQELRTLITSASDITGFSSSIGHFSELWWHVSMQEGGEFNLVQLKDKPARNSRDSMYGRGPSRTVTIPKTASRYSAKQNLSDINTLWDLRKNEKGIYVHFLKGNVPVIDSICVLDGATGEKIFGTQSPIPIISTASTTTSAAASTTTSAAASSTKKKRKYFGDSKASSSALPAPASSPIAAEPSSTTPPPCVLLEQMTLNKGHSFNWSAFVELLELVNRTCPPGTSAHLCWVTSESASKDFHYVFPTGGDVNIVKQITQWLIIVPDDRLAPYTSSSTTTQSFLQ